MSQSTDQMISLVVCRYISFTSDRCEGRPDALPSRSLGSGVAFYWDIFEEGTGSIYYDVLGTPGVDQRAIVQFVNVSGFEDTVTAQLVLHTAPAPLSELLYGIEVHIADAKQIFIGDKLTIGLQEAQGSRCTSILGIST